MPLTEYGLLNTAETPGPHPPLQPHLMPYHPCTVPVPEHPTLSPLLRPSRTLIMPHSLPGQLPHTLLASGDITCASFRKYFPSSSPPQRLLPRPQNSANRTLVFAVPSKHGPLLQGLPPSVSDTAGDGPNQHSFQKPSLVPWAGHTPHVASAPGSLPAEVLPLSGKGPCLLGLSCVALNYRLPVTE